MYFTSETNINEHLLVRRGAHQLKYTIMIALTLKTEAQTLGYYPELANYLNNFRSPLVGLLGNFSTGEMLVVEHAMEGCRHTVISIPKMDGVLRYDMMTELYRSSKRYDTVANIEFPIGKAVNYETFLVIEGGGRALTLHEQPDWEAKSFRVIAELWFDETYTSCASINGVRLDYDAESNQFSAPKAALDPILDQIQSGSSYQGIYRIIDEYSGGTYRALIKRDEYQTHADAVLGIEASESFIGVLLAIYLEGNRYTVVLN